MVDISGVFEFMKDLLGRSEASQEREENLKDAQKTTTTTADQELAMDAVVQVVCAIIARAEAVQSSSYTISVVLKRPSASKSSTIETETVSLQALTRSVANSLAWSRVQ